MNIFKSATISYFEPVVYCWRKLVNWSVRFGLWYLNSRLSSAMWDLISWRMIRSGVSLQLRNDYALDYVEEQVNAADDKFHRILDKRNAFAYKHNLKPAKDTPDDWRERYKAEHGIAPETSVSN